MFIKIWINGYVSCVENVDGNYPQDLFGSYPQIIITLFNLSEPGSTPKDHD